MSDADLLTFMGEQRDLVRMTVPLEVVVGRGRVVRRRRRISALAITGAAAAIAVVTGTSLMLSSHAGPHQPGLQLAAWSVVNRPGGMVDVTIRELRDPAGLQRTLRDDGVPASVIFASDPNSQPNPCQPYNDPQRLSRVVTLSDVPGQPPGSATVITIRPAEIPHNAGLQIMTSNMRVGINLVTASPDCTGA